MGQTWESNEWLGKIECKYHLFKCVFQATLLPWQEGQQLQQQQQKKKVTTYINDMAAELQNNSYSVALFKLFHSALERGCYVYIMKRDKAEGGHNESGREPICWTDRTLHLNVSPAVCCRALVLHWISLGMRYSQFSIL